MTIESHYFDVLYCKLTEAGTDHQTVTRFFMRTASPDRREEGPVSCAARRRQVAVTSALAGGAGDGGS